MTATISDVIEAHRLAIGADRVHVSLGPKATPELVAKELAKLQAKSAIFAAFRLEEQLEAQIARLRGVISDVARHVRLGETDQILSKTDWIVDVDLEGDIRSMFDAREKSGEPVPPGTAELLTEIDAERARPASIN